MGQDTSRHRRSRAVRIAAAAYLLLVTAASVTHDLAGRPDGWSAALTLAAFPGSTVVTVLLLGLSAAWPDLSGTGLGPLSLLVPHATGAVLNVLLVRGAFLFARHFVREARRSRAAARPARPAQSARSARVRRETPQ
ncbi:hypothetical protein [Streptomyces sp. NPDC005012]|uniref:hypothetical protein n=1 Tax=Streptomyces sp. NPDC005012 TaxID=3154558 RepID=UPI00339EB4B4